MIAVDNNLLVYAHRPECPWDARTIEVIDGLWSRRISWGIPVHCLVEFAAVVSNRRLRKAPSQPEHIADQVAAWTESPSCRLLAEDQTVWEHAVALARAACARRAPGTTPGSRRPASPTARANCGRRNATTPASRRCASGTR